ncbi:MFS transporter [Bosea thiooxidans]
MTSDNVIEPAGARAHAGPWPLLRWFASSATLSVPQAAGPVAFSLVALSLTGDPSQGAAIMVAMTLAQVLGALPITRMGKSWSTTRFLRLLVGIRTAALVAVAILAAYGASVGWLIAFATIAGSVNGAAFGYLRSLLNALTPASQLPRALGISATLNEVTFVLAPVMASGLGVISPVFAILAIAILGAFPALLVPDIGAAHLPDAPQSSGSVLSPTIALWLACAAAGGATVAAVEIGAVALALSFGYQPALAIMFTVPLCLASVAGGIWVSFRNRRSPRTAVVIQLAIMAAGAALAACEISVMATVVGTVLIGAVLAPLGTHYSLVLDSLAPPHRRAEVFALLRTANAAGVILAGIALTALSLTTALATVTVLMFAAALAVGAERWRGASMKGT